jgi:hypothetical protein
LSAAFAGVARANVKRLSVAMLFVFMIILLAG